MREQPDLSSEFKTALRAHQPSANFDRIETRKCTSESYEGIEYEFYGWYVPLRPIIDVVAGKENFAIESLSYVNEGTVKDDLEPHLNLFLADLRESQPHPAFTET